MGLALAPCGSYTEQTADLSIQNELGSGDPENEKTGRERMAGVKGGDPDTRTRMSECRDGKVGSDQKGLRMG